MIIIGSDHAALDLKKAIFQHLQSQGLSITDIGPYTADSCDYPDYAQKVCAEVLKDEKNLGILICGTGIGMSIAANKIKGIRCALCGDTFSARMTKLHNNANVLALGARILGEGLALDIVDAFVGTAFSSDPRHIRRIEKLEK